MCCDPAPADAPNSQELIAVILARGRLGSLGQRKKNGILNQQKLRFNQQKWDFNGISLVKTDKNGDLMRFQCNLMSQNGG